MGWIISPVAERTLVSPFSGGELPAIGSALAEEFEAAAVAAAAVESGSVKEFGDASEALALPGRATGCRDTRRPTWPVQGPDFVGQAESGR